VLSLGGAMATTTVYFIRHGIAIAREAGRDDEARSLTPKGIQKVQSIAQRLGELGIGFDILLTSPLLRAQQTADILQAAGLAETLQIFSPLRPDGNIEDWIAWLKKQQSNLLQGSSTAEPSTELSIALVGHEPCLSQWAQQLVGGQSADRWVLKKAGIIGLRVPHAARAIGNSELFWLSPPRLLL
jgi:phosphohistidine phosphatase